MRLVPARKPGAATTSQVVWETKLGPRHQKPGLLGRPLLG